MPARPQGEIIREQGERLSSLTERLDNIRREFDRIEADVVRLEGGRAAEERARHDLDRRLALVARDVERLEKRLDDLHSHRWDVLKIVLGAIVGMILAVIAEPARKTIERFSGSGSRQAAPATPNAGRGR